MLRPSPENLRAPREGAVFVYMLLSLAVIVGILALTVDGGRLMDDRRNAQGAAEAAALAAAENLYRNFVANQGTDADGTARQAALAAAAARGYANDQSSSTVTVNIPPLAGPFAGQAGYTEVIILSNIGTGFGAAFSGSDRVPVRARAVARGRYANLGLVTLRRTGANAYNQSGNANVAVVGAGIVINSNDPAACKRSSNGSMSASFVDVCGGVSGGSDECDDDNGGKMLIRTGERAIPDPLRFLPAPGLLGYTVRSVIKLSISSGNVVLQPGVYQGGISLSGQAVVTMAPGVYIMEGGGFTCSGQAALTAQKAVLYNTAGIFPAGPITISGQGAINWTPPDSGTCAGISIYQDRAVTQPLQLSGNGKLQVTGTIYAASAQATLSGNGSSNTMGGAFVCASLSASGNASIKIGRGGAIAARAPDFGLVE